MKQIPKQPDTKDFNQVNATSRPPQDTNKKQLKYTDWEIQHNKDTLRLVRSARDIREQTYAEWDSMTYTERVENDWLSMLSYVRPAKDKNDIRLNPGITRDKILSAVALAMSYNFEVEVRAFDQKDVFLPVLAKSASDLIYKSDKLEGWQFKREEVYLGQSSLGTFFTMETQEFPISHRKTRIPLNKFGSLNVDWNDMPRKDKVNFRTVILDPRMVIMGNIHEPDISKQPFIAVAMVVSEAEARNMFGTFDRWNDVPLRNGDAYYGEEDVFAQYRTEYAISDTLAEGMVEIQYFMRSIEYGNELQITLNGVPMLPVKMKKKVGNQYHVSAFPLTSWSYSGEYPIVDWHLERNLRFFYSKGFASKTLFEEKIVEFFFRWMVEKAMRSINPTLVNNSGVNITRDILAPGSIVTDIPAEQIKTLLPAELIQGISSGDVSMLNMVKEFIDQKTVSKEFQGQGSPYQTAIQFTEAQKAQLMKLGSLIDGIVRGEMRRADLRLRNSIIPYWFSKYDYDMEKKKSSSESFGNAIVEIYDHFTVEREDSGGKYNSIIKIADTEDTETKSDKLTGFDIMRREKREDKNGDGRNKYLIIDPDRLDFIKTLFFYTVKPNERDNDSLHRTRADADIAMAINMFPEMADKQKLAEKFAKSRGDTYDGWFSEGAGISPQMLGGSALGSDSIQGLMQPQGGSAVPVGGLNPSSIAPPSSLALQK